MAPEVFVSYASKDRPVVLKLAKAIRAAGVSLWLDVDDIGPGARYDVEIVRATRSAKVMLVMCSVASLHSHNVQQELRLAWRPGIRYLPILLDDALEVFPDQVRYFLEGWQWIEVRGSSPESALPRILDALAAGGVGVEGRPAVSGTSPAPIADEFQALVQAAKLSDAIWPERYQNQPSLRPGSRALGVPPSESVYRFEIGSQMCVAVDSDADAHLLLLDLDPGGAIYCLCPSAFSPSTEVRPGRNYLPRPDARYRYFELTGEPGRAQLVAILTVERCPLAWDSLDAARRLSKDDVGALMRWLASLGLGEVKIAATCYHSVR